jgi:hypothetical protein
MQVLRRSSVEEYCSWYLQREARKGDQSPIPELVEQRVELMWQRHGR